MLETIVCISLGFLATLALFVARSTRSLGNGSVPGWLHFSSGVDDCWKGCRQLFTTEEDMPFNICGFLHPVTGQWVFSQLYGLPLVWHHR
eukprot:4682212-Karenia_brevis.AAC.1